MIINKIKSILNILSNNIEKYNVEIWKYNDIRLINKKEESYTEWQIQFLTDKLYNLSLIKMKNNSNIRFSIFDKASRQRFGKSIEIEIPSNERTEIKLLFDKVILNSEKFVENELKNLEL